MSQLSRDDCHDLPVGWVHDQELALHYREVIRPERWNITRGFDCDRLELDAARYAGGDIFAPGGCVPVDNVDGG